MAPSKNTIFRTAKARQEANVRWYRFNAVLKACQALFSRGEKITQRNVCRELGRRIDRWIEESALVARTIIAYRKLQLSLH